MAYLKHNTYVAPPSNLDMASPEWADYQQRIRANQAQGREISAENQRRRDGGITKWLPKLAYGVIGAATGGAAAPLFGGGAAAGSAASSAAASVPATVPAAAGGAMNFGNLLKLGQLAVPAVTGLFGMRSQNRALDRQSQMEQGNLNQQMEMARENEMYRRSEAARVAAEEAKRWQAEEAFRARQLAADEEDRAYNRRLLEEREARRAPKRAAGQQAMLRLQDLLRLGRG